MGRRFCWLLSCGALCSLLALSASVFGGQESETEALTEEQVLSLVTSSKLGVLPAERIVELIKKRGLQFSITEALLLDLQARETDPVVLETLRALQRRGAESKGRPEADWPRFLESVRAKALAYTDELPNFICTQVTQRHVHHRSARLEACRQFCSGADLFRQRGTLQDPDHWKQRCYGCDNRESLWNQFDWRIRDCYALAVRPGGQHQLSPRRKSAVQRARNRPHRL